MVEPRVFVYSRLDVFSEADEAVPFGIYEMVISPAYSTMCITTKSSGIRRMAYPTASGVKGESDGWRGIYGTSMDLNATRYITVIDSPHYIHKSSILPMRETW